MSKEYEEMIEKVAKAFHYNSIDTKDIISHLETSTCRLAVVRKKPDIGYERYWTNSAQEVKE